MMMIKSIFVSFIIASVLLTSVFAEVGGKRTLVVLENLSQKNLYSTFFKTLEKKGYELDFQPATTEVVLEKYGDFNYDHLVLFAPTLESKTITSNAVLNFIDGGNNVLIAGSNKISETIRDIAQECGMDIEEDNTLVYDHFNYDKSQPDHSLLVADQFIQDSPIILQGLDKPVIYKGIGHKIRSNPLNFAVLTGSSTAYSGKKTNGASTKLMGKSCGLVSSLQARNNARVTFSGSIELFTDKSFGTTLEKNQSGNKEFVENLVSWTFQERGILRSSQLELVKISTESNSTVAPDVFTIKDEVSYSLKVEEYDGVKNEWVPYVSQIQLEVIMLDPYIRTFIKGDSKGIYKINIKLPDVYGVFTFEATVQKPGYGQLEHIIRKPIVPFRHDSYERFIPAAFPYYAACFSMIIGTFIFSIIFLFNKDPKHIQI
ncbi:hypothetical protein DICPUDRAFT_158975 [Dictyostelium purpureum]|uniref:Dolichyl-diphosphooligosaccharide--protein glycosyltransferase 48 kDa subunit n=1 Tax=Dictyostelium purpureum TaxID=5786 RepID=F1A2Y6_DICPU|nr:uncharacterized protein DICPUDRAFT_158975 [Dictyostelium purpureum]EGC29437.1 hypothetical protein DICPUDRAFT_158975 [Dictyostelium purpureum]|eukprot:XP_003294030.1 hypothetical protein DICPUDRAFT_158975 [Dictyostelium purpureum]